MIKSPRTWLLTAASVSRYVAKVQGTYSLHHVASLYGWFLLFLLIDSNQLQAQTRIGLHVTQEELNIWRERAKVVPYQSKSGPYRSTGDVSENSPGDWDRILQNANRFLSNPGADRWKGYTGGGCVPRNSAEPLKKAYLLRDAGFAYLITSDSRYLNAVRSEILAQTGESGTDFSKTNRWCNGVLNDGAPGFLIADWLSRLLVGYDYIRSSISQSDRQRIDTWFRNAAFFFQREVDLPFSRIYTNRLAGNYNLTLYAINSKIERIAAISHYGGRKIPGIAKWYNNRRGSMVRFYALVGIQQNENQLRSSAKLYVKEWLKFSTFPDGIIGEFERWENNKPDLGWSYASYAIGQAVDIANHFARAGDQELYKYSTSDGAIGTQGGNKTILLTIKNLLSYTDGSVKRYATTDSKKAGNPAALIDNINPSTGWAAVNDIWASAANVYYKDSYITSVYTRTRSGTKSYPQQPASAGPDIAWNGSGGLYPGKLFMFGQMEGKVWPYYNGSGTAPINAPKPVQQSSSSPSDKTTITVNAKGTQSGGKYAHFRLLINGLPTDVQAYTSGSYKAYNLTVNYKLSSISSVLVHFDNEDRVRDMFVESIVVGGKKYVSTGTNVTYDKGALDGKDVVRGQVIMPWAGALVFKLSGSTSPTPTPTPTPTPPSNGSVSGKLAVNARGTSAGGQYAHFKVLINDKQVGESYTTASYKDYSFNTGTSSIQKVSVVFDNNALINKQDRDLFVNSITVNGKVIASNASNVRYDKGNIDGKDVIPGQKLMPWRGALIFTFSNGNRQGFEVNDAPENGIAFNAIKLSPNPNRGTFNLAIAFEQESEAVVKITDLAGRSFYHKVHSTARKLEEKIDVSVIPAGMYIISVQSVSGIISEKFIKE